jgi:hypothetical protein
MAEQLYLRAGGIKADVIAMDKRHELFRRTRRGAGRIEYLDGLATMSWDKELWHYKHRVSWILGIEFKKFNQQYINASTECKLKGKRIKYDFSRVSVSGRGDCTLATMFPQNWKQEVNESHNTKDHIITDAFQTRR